MREKKLTVTQGGTRTRDLANGLPCSDQLSYRVTRQLSGRIRVLKAEHKAGLSSFVRLLELKKVELHIVPFHLTL